MVSAGGGGAFLREFLQVSPSRPARLKSLDVFRGASIASMIVVNSPGARPDTYPQLLHAAWNGWTFADTIFPCFLFIVGVSLTLSTAARAETQTDRASLVWHAVRRSLLLYGCGVFIDYLVFPARGFPYFAFRDHLQLTGVLEKIAVCYLVSFLIFLGAGWRGVVVGIVGLNVVYLGLLFLYPVPGCGAGVLSPECSFPSYLNKIVLEGHTWGDTYDPDGIGAVLPAISSVLFGVLAGLLLRIEPRSRQRLLWLVGGGLGLVAGGVLLARWIPINKPLWTTSYAVSMAGLASICLAACYWVVDVRQAGSWLKPLEILGLNAVAAYLVSRPDDHALRVHVFGESLYTDVCRRLASPPNASLLFAFVVLTAVYAIVWFMYRRRWFLKF
jgi:predicted acyltransferase